MVRSVAVVAIAVLGLVAPVAAQTGSLKGKVTDGKGAPVAGAQVTLEYRDEISRRYQLKTDRRGEFTQIGLAPGNYLVSVTAEKVGAATGDVRVRVSETTEVGFVLEAASANPATSELTRIFGEGVALSGAGDHDGAIAKFQEAITLLSACHNCYYNIGHAYLQKKDEARAEEAFRQALDRKGDYVEALNSLATLYNSQKRLDEASALSARAAEFGGGDAGTVYNRGIILWNAGKIAEARVKFEEAIGLAQNHAPSHFQLGMARLNEGQTAAAVASFETYLKLAPQGEYAAQAAQKVALLKK